jgi:NAD(P)-dependent dehydrogenase (short-subunit alcohol dehydrogenase family)
MKKNPRKISKSTIANSGAGHVASNSLRLAGKTALITGAGSGIGAAIAERFANEGASLVLNDQNKLELEKTASTLAKSGTTVFSVVGDVSKERVAARLVETAAKEFPAIHVLVNNAGVAGSSLGDGPVTTSLIESWDLVLRINLRSVFLCSRFAIPLMIKGGGGTVVNMSSILALTGSSDFFISHAYAASKGAIVSLTRAMAAHYADMGVRVNALCPGLIATAMTERVQLRKDAMKYVAGKQRLLKGLGSPDGVADAALFLASDEARHITGIILPVDGGWSSGN